MQIKCITCRHSYNQQFLKKHNNKCVVCGSGIFESNQETVYRDASIIAARKTAHKFRSGEYVK